MEMERAVYKGPMGENIVVTYHRTGTFDDITFVSVVAVNGEVKYVNTYSVSKGNSPAETSANLFEGRQILEERVQNWFQYTYYGDVERLEIWVSSMNG